MVLELHLRVKASGGRVTIRQKALRAAFGTIVLAGVLIAATGRAPAAPIVYFGEDLGAQSTAAAINSKAARDAFVAALPRQFRTNFEFAGVVTPTLLSFTNFFDPFPSRQIAHVDVTYPIPLVSEPDGGRFAISGANYLTDAKRVRGAASGYL